MNRRDFLRYGLAAGTALGVTGHGVRAANPSDDIRLGFISCGGRGRELMSTFDRIEGVKIAGLCDPDENRLKAAQQDYPQAKAWIDLRHLLDDQSIHAVVIATGNHWHCLATIWALQAGKDVYVEKPLSHNPWEGRQLVAAVAKYGRICQVGLQQRSDPMQAEIKRFLHEEQALGKILSARVNRYGVRGSIGKRTQPLPIPEGVDYDLWLGPAADEPIFRNQLHYDWHWDWNTGNGEMGNWGVHILDDLRNNVFRDEVALPRQVMVGGGRVVWNDAGETPNVHVAYLDTGRVPVVVGLANITREPGSPDSPAVPGPPSGYVVHCEGGRFEGQRGSAAAFDQHGQLIKEFRGNGGNGGHQQNFIDAVRQGDAGRLNANIQVGHDSTGWCHLMNLGFRSSSGFSPEESWQAAADCAPWDELLQETRTLLQAHGMEMTSPGMRLSRLWDIDVDTGQFVGPDAERPNDLLRRECRSPYIVPEIIG